MPHSIYPGQFKLVSAFSYDHEGDIWGSAGRLKGSPAVNFSNAQRRGDRSWTALRSFHSDRLLLAIRIVMMVMMVMVVVTNNHDNLCRQRQGSSEAEHEGKSKQNLFHKGNTLRAPL